MAIPVGPGFVRIPAKEWAESSIEVFAGGPTLIPGRIRRTYWQPGFELVPDREDDESCLAVLFHALQGP